jgi:GxxExxY protein
MDHPTTRDCDSILAQIEESVTEVLGNLGHGFPLVTYRNALLLELAERKLSAELEQELNIYYRSRLVGQQRLKMVVERQVLVDLRESTELAVNEANGLQTLLKAANLPAALLIDLRQQPHKTRRLTLEAERDPSDA